MGTGDDHEAELKLRTRLGLALKTTARDVLLLLYRQRFPKQNPNKTPIEVVNKISRCRTFLQSNQSIENKIKSNKEQKFDVTVLYLLLRNTCGLSKKEEVWNSSRKLEGSIEILRNLRNEDAHWTQEECSLESLERAWADLECAIINILNKAGFDDHIPRFEEDLKNIRRGKPPRTVSVEGRVKEELLDQYRTSKKTLLQPLVWAGAEYSFHSAVNQTYTPVRITTLVRGELTEVDVSDVVARERLAAGEERGGGEEPRVTVIQGESGTGKTSLLRHLASSWAERTPSYLHAVNSFDFVLLMDLTAVSKGTYTVPDVIQELLPRTYGDWKVSTIVNLLARTGDRVMFMIDAFDERYEAFEEAFKNLLSRCPKATFLVTTRPHCTQDILKLCEQHARVVTTHGFGRKAAVEYATKLLKMHDRENDLEDFINAVSPYEEIITIPQLLCWSCWFWLEHGQNRFTTRKRVFASITEFLLRKMCHIKGDRVVSKEVPRTGKIWLDHVASLALTLAQKDHTVMSQSCDEIKKLKKEARKLKLPPYVAVSTLMQCDSIMTGLGQQYAFQFVHQSHASFLAAHHVKNILTSYSSASLRNLLKEVKPKQKKLILLFLVGHLFDDNEKEDVSLKVLHELGASAKEFVSFFDITYYLDLLEESNNSEKLSEVLSAHMPRQKNSEPSLWVMGSATGKRMDMSQLWLRPKELRRTKPLLQILSKAQPKRVWLRLCEGPRNDNLRHVPGHRVEEGDPEEALWLLTKAYMNDSLLELIITDCTFRSSPIWPSSVKCLMFQRCNFNSQISLPKGLKDVSLTNCNDIQNVDLYNSSVNSIMTVHCTQKRPVKIPERLGGCGTAELEPEELWAHRREERDDEDEFAPAL